jgi:hypothetical protein
MPQPRPHELPRSGESSRTTKRSPRARVSRAGSLRGQTPMAKPSSRLRARERATRSFQTARTAPSARPLMRFLPAGLSSIAMSSLVLPARCCVPCSKPGLTTICRLSWNVSSPLRSSGSRAANKRGSDPAAPVAFALTTSGAASVPDRRRALAFSPLVCHRSPRMQLAKPALMSAQATRGIIP